MTRVAAIAFAGLADLCLAGAARAMPVAPAALATAARWAAP